MAKEEPIQLEGQVTEVLPNATFRVELTNGHNVLATLGGNMRRFRIRVLQGDRVTIEAGNFFESVPGGADCWVVFLTPRPSITVCAAGGSSILSRVPACRPRHGSAPR